MLKSLLILLAIGAACFLRPSGPPWLQATPDWVFWLLAVIPLVIVVHRIIRALRANIADLSD